MLPKQISIPLGNSPVDEIKSQAILTSPRVKLDFYMDNYSPITKYCNPILFHVSFSLRTKMIAKMYFFKSTLAFKSCKNLKGANINN